MSSATGFEAERSALSRGVYETQNADGSSAWLGFAPIAARTAMTGTAAPRARRYSLQARAQ